MFQVRYTGYRDRPQEERQVRFQNACREGHTEIAFVATGTNLQLVFAPPSNSYMQNRECDFDKEPGKVRVIRILFSIFSVISQKNLNIQTDHFARYTKGC